MLSRDELRDHLVHSRIAGDVATSRENNLDHYSSLANRDPYYMLGPDLRAASGRSVTCWR